MIAADPQTINELVSRLAAETARIPPEAMRQIAEVLRASFEQNFKERGRYNSSDAGITPFSGGSDRWKPLAASTRVAYAAVGKSTERTLARTGGGLAASIEVSVSGTNQVSISSNKAQARAQQFGSTHTVRITPRSRKYFWMMYYALTGTGDKSRRKKLKDTLSKAEKRRKRDEKKGEDTATHSKAIVRLSEAAALYKGLALTKKETLEIIIPASPYIVIQRQDLIEIAEEISRTRKR